MLSKEQFGQRLYETRKKNHETQADLAALLGCVKSHISEMESGKKITTAEKRWQFFQLTSCFAFFNAPAETQGHQQKISCKSK